MKMIFSFYYLSTDILVNCLVFISIHPDPLIPSLLSTLSQYKSVPLRRQLPDTALIFVQLDDNY